MTQIMELSKIIYYKNSSMRVDQDVRVLGHGGHLL